jgi:hypothetical protein
MPAPASMPNAKTATAAITRAGVRVRKDLSFAQGCSAMGTRQRSQPRRNAKDVSCREGSPRVTEGVATLGNHSAPAP